MKKIAIIGCGIAGITSAYFLAKKGYDVTVIDKESYPAMECSYANGGQISVSNSEVWTTWSNIAKGIKWLGKKDAPLLIRPNLDWDKIKWLSKFLMYTAQNDWARNTATTIKLGLEARLLYEQIIAEENITFDRLQQGILHIYKNPKYFEHAQMVQELYQGNGCEWRIINNTNDILKLEPGLKNTKDIIGAVYTSNDWTGDIHKFCIEMHKILKTKYGVRFEFNKKITDLNELADYDSIVIANGSGSRHLSKIVGDNLPVYPVKGYSITIDLKDLKSQSAAPYVSLLDDEAKIVSSRFPDRFRVAGTAELTGDNWDIRKDRIDPLINWVKQNFPDIETREYKSWACLRPMTPNMMPIVKQSTKNTKVFYHVGHGHLGWTLSPATAKQLVDLIAQ